jgi:hypothetical protein
MQHLSRKRDIGTHSIISLKFDPFVTTATAPGRGPVLLSVADGGRGTLPLALACLDVASASITAGC